METPKKTVPKKAASKSTDVKKSDIPDLPAKKRIIDDDDDEDFDIPLEEIGGYEAFEGFEDDEDF